MHQTSGLVAYSSKDKGTTRRSSLTPRRSWTSSKGDTPSPAGNCWPSWSACTSSETICLAGSSPSAPTMALWSGCWISRNRRDNWPGGWNTFSSSAFPLCIAMGRSTPTLMPCRATQRMRKGATIIDQVSCWRICHAMDVPTVGNIMKNGATFTTKWTM